MGYILLAVLTITVLYLITIYNTLVVRKNRIENGFAQIQVQLKRRYDLIPALTQSVKGYMKYEQETLEAVIKARNEASMALSHIKEVVNHAQDIKRLSHKEQQLVNRLGSIQVLMEDYPELKANENVSRLMEELGTTENRIAFARQAFNDFVYSFNAYRQSFPQNMIADRFGFDQDASMLEFEDAKAIQQVPGTSL
ncbi:LemA family protein [Sulfurovum mangrovi]|uniref:LemA family protein n=1 Tax=Sulfurovum mangrovi TaxID=2893889 RepID=UPI001E5ED441|nr:LemA family protein [Sulfurovum mangrovi]UFH58770.1 LemA family protein [Sulfurovum mangrovi]